MAPGGRKPYPLDFEARRYSYVERSNRALLELFREHVLSERPAPAVLDIGCGAGANARAIRELAPEATIVGIEPSAEGARLARAVADEVFEGTLERWLDAGQDRRFDAVLLSDVIEHIADPLALLRRLNEHPGTRVAAWIISVPNYAVWYNRLRTLAGSFSYSWSGLYDRTHLRFFTRRSVRELLERAGRSVTDESSTPSLVQSAAPLLRLPFESKVDSGEHLALGESEAFRAYERWVEPVEARVCSLWPELLAFQIVCLCRAA
ncbi:MAG TPA: class I SAM-dependent methyltransferase [Polyangiaceae bacterium]